MTIDISTAALIIGGWLGYVVYGLCSIYDRQIRDAFKFLKHKFLKRKEQ